jgi:RNA polymerase sigma-70 factor (ECF subfamily)
VDALEDAAIIELFFARDESAIAETDRKYGPYLAGVAFGILRSREDAEEVVSDTYHGAWRAIPPTRPNVLRHFLARIARNLCFKRLEHDTAAKRAHIQTSLDELEECVPDGDSEPERLWEARELAGLLDRFLDGLGELDCALFVARYFYCQTLGEIGERYGLSRRSAKYRLEKLRKKLRKQLEAEGVVL